MAQSATHYQPLHWIDVNVELPALAALLTLRAAITNSAGSCVGLIIGLFVVDEKSLSVLGIEPASRPHLVFEKEPN
jgi:hypothetical protein